MGSVTRLDSQKKKKGEATNTLPETQESMVSATPTPEEAEPSRLGHVDTSRTGKENVQTHQGYIRSSDQEPETPRTAGSSSSASNTVKQPSDLPLSRGKAIALVATVTGAAFLNVS